VIRDLVRTVRPAVVVNRLARNSRTGLALLNRTIPFPVPKHQQFRTQFHHVIDIAPTILEVAGVKPPSKVSQSAS
jgi:phosphoglycerol transferase MdoB-like AlkP superfamily enzyme